MAPEDFDSLVTERRSVTLLGQATTSKALQTHVLQAAWFALDAWVLDKLALRKGVHIPSLARLTWQVVELPDGSKMARPVFALTEAFCRAHGLPYRKAAEADVVPCAELDYSLLALKYTDTLTRDMVFSSLRDVVFGLGHRIGARRAVTLKLSVGTLTAVDGKVTFRFDAGAISRRREELGGPKRLAASAAFNRLGAQEPPQAQPQQASPRVPAPQASSLQASSLARLREDAPRAKTAQPRRNSKAAQSPPPSPLSALAAPLTALDPDRVFSAAEARLLNLASSGSSADIAACTRLDGEGAPVGAASRRFAKIIAPEASALSRVCDERRLLPAETTVLDKAFKRCLASMEYEARRIEAERVAASLSGVAAEENHGSKLDQWKQTNRDLQAFLRDQIAAKKVRDSKLAEAPASVPALSQSLSVAEALGAPVRAQGAAVGARSKRGRGAAVSTEFLVQSLEGQIKERAALSRAERDDVLAEERRFIDHVNLELAQRTAATKARQAAAQSDLLRHWETSQHLKNLHQLQSFGSEAMLAYADAAAQRRLASDAVPRAPPLLPPARQLAATLYGASGRVDFKNFAGGFDPRDATSTNELAKTQVG